MFRSVRRGFVLLAAAAASLALGAAERTPVRGGTPTSAAVAARPAAPVLEQGEIDGAKFTIARPAKWNHRLLLLAHGLRAESAPLVADLFPEHFAYKTLLDEGWIVAKTSYRRNGLIVADAITDLDALRAYVARTDGEPERVLVEGESMGGLIAILMAERTPDFDLQGRPAYTGAVAIGAALSVREPNATLGLSLHPKIPVIFLTNQSELDGPQKYLETFAPLDRSDIRPVLFRVSRDGHVNVNQRERLAALRALTAWIDRGRETLPRPPEGARFFDATVRPAPQPSRVTPQEDKRGFTAHVIEVSAGYGNLFIDAQPGDFEAAGIRPMVWFQLKAGEKTFRVRYGRDFDSVKRGEWVVFPNADGFMWLARNFGDAAGMAGVKLGDAVTLRRYDSAGNSGDGEQETGGR
jgi:pimeloyl-ACP methyl ester carboxylesterase